MWMFPKIGFFLHQIIHFRRVFHYKQPSMLGHPYFWKHPCVGHFGISTDALRLRHQSSLQNAPWQPSAVRDDRDDRTSHVSFTAEQRVFCQVCHKVMVHHSQNFLEIGSHVDVEKGTLSAMVQWNIFLYLKGFCYLEIHPFFIGCPMDNPMTQAELLAEREASASSVVNNVWDAWSTVGLGFRWDFFWMHT